MKSEITIDRDAFDAVVKSALTKLATDIRSSDANLSVDDAMKMGYAASVVLADVTVRLFETEEEKTDGN